MKRVLTFLLIMISTVTLSGCMNSASEPLTYTGIALDTVISIQIYDADDPSLLTDCVEICKKYENMFSKTIPTSDISKINDAKGEAITVSPETIEIIEAGIHYGKLSNGAFDITIGSVSNLWDFKSDTPAIPSQDAIDEALSHVDYQKIHINDQTVSLEDPDTVIDVGGIAKGYIADKIKEYLQSKDVSSALINLGGNVVTIGTKPDNTPFHIGITKPFTQSDEMISSVSVSDQSVVTSGIYQRYFKIDDTIYHHILDPKTGYPAFRDHQSVTIVTQSSMDADALSTTCFLLGYDKTKELYSSLKNTEIIFVDSDDQLQYIK